MTNEELAQVIAKAIAKQGIDTDNLGDNESLILFSLDDIVLNLVELAEEINKALKEPR